MTTTTTTLSFQSRRHRISYVWWWLLLLIQLVLFDSSSFCLLCYWRCHAFCPLNVPIRRASRRPTAASQSQSQEVNNDSSSNSSINNKNHADVVASSSFYETAVPGPPLETKPDYANIVGPLGRWTDSLFMTVFRHQLEYYSTLDESNKSQGQPPEPQQQSKPQPHPRPLFGVQDEYQAIIDLAATMNRAYANRTESHIRAQRVLQSLFPSWMPSSYAVLFSKPFPAFSARMNAWATFVAGTWLMGECEINNVAVDGDDDNDDDNNRVSGIGQGLLVKRCRFLEESGCASICVNSCKIPTQNFFLQDMGLPLTMEPNYDTFECQFSFGKTPTDETEALAKSTPCLTRCPAVGSLRRFHNDAGQQKAISQQQQPQSTIASTIKTMDDGEMLPVVVTSVMPLDLPAAAIAPPPPCKMMGD